MVALKRHESSRNFCVLVTSPSSANLAPRAATSEERRGEERAGPTAGSMGGVTESLLVYAHLEY